MSFTIFPLPASRGLVLLDWVFELNRVSFPLIQPCYAGSIFTTIIIKLIIIIIIIDLFFGYFILKNALTIFALPQPHVAGR